MQKNKQFLLLCSLLFFIACAKDVNLDVPNALPKIVINCLFTQDSAWQVSLYQSASASGGSIFREVKDAQIEIYEDDKLLTTLPVFKTKFAQDKQRIPYYTEINAASHPPRCGHSYKIKVKAVGFESVEASDDLLFPPIVEDFVVDSLVAKTPNTNIPFFRAEIELNGYYHYYLLKNNTNAVNYYGAAFAYEAKIKPSGSYIVAGQDIPKEDTSYTKHLDAGLGLINTVIDNYVSLVTIFPDTLWKGNKLKITNLYFPRLEDRITIPQEIYFEAYTFSPNYQKYSETAIQQLANRKDPFSEPKSVFTNVQGGYGVFASYATQRIRIPIKK